MAYDSETHPSGARLQCGRSMAVDVGGGRVLSA